MSIPCCKIGIPGNVVYKDSAATGSLAQGVLDPTVGVSVVALVLHRAREALPGGLPAERSVPIFSPTAPLSRVDP